MSGRTPCRAVLSQPAVTARRHRGGARSGSVLRRCRRPRAGSWDIGCSGRLLSLIAPTTRWFRGRVIRSSRSSLAFDEAKRSCTTRGTFQPATHPNRHRIERPRAVSSEAGAQWDDAAIMGGLYGDGIIGLTGAFDRSWVMRMRADIETLFTEARATPGGALPRGPERFYVEVHPERLRGFV